uniref:Bcl-2 Bcl-2 homology region 1-3 domain-containing protein n=2 Tax=Xenopus tropicalis TaxID=8364 RepID=A0A6I8QFQ5_XENTR
MILFSSRCLVLLMAATDKQELDQFLSSDVEQVTQQTEIVFQSYSYHRLQIERDQNEYSLALDEEIVEPQQSESTNLISVGQQLAKIGDDINERYQEQFDDILKHLNPSLDNAYSYFKKIASSLFENGINWGRILSLLGFGYRMAVYVVRNGQRGFFRIINQWMVRYVMESCIAQWISSRGGWVAFFQLTNYSVKYVIAALSVALTLQFLLQRLT